MKVLKFGGTSVSCAQNIRSIANIIHKNTGCIIVVSAISGTTNALVEICELMKNSDNKSIIEIINKLKDKHLIVIEQLFNNIENISRLKKATNLFFEELKQLATQDFTIQIEKQLLIKGEYLSSLIINEYLLETGLNSILLDALNFMRIDKDAEPDEFYIKKEIESLINKNNSYEFYVTQGYMCLDDKGEISNLGRGGSDYTATIIAAAINASEVQIWTDIDGLHNNDPRYVQNTKSIKKLSYTEAEELAYFGAKILHPTCIGPVKFKNIPIRLKNTMNPESSGTLINAESNQEKFTAIAIKDDNTVIKIKSGRMLMAYGFLRKIFEIFEELKTPVDVVTTSEVTVSMSIDNVRFLNQIVEKLKRLGQVQVFSQQSIICIVGDLQASNTGLLSIISTALQNIPVSMISYGSNSNNISLLIDSKYKIEALNSLSNNLFNNIQNVNYKQLAAI